MMRATQAQRVWKTYFQIHWMIHTVVCQNPNRLLYKYNNL